MTIGQRIAQRRKLLGLSQEALGDKVGVSRQAISKWEADAALPEIDKLIALSRLFSVTVGWLLGVEERLEEKEALTEEQLNAMEQLIRLYAAPAPPEPEKKRNAPLFLSILALILSMATVLSCLTHHNNLSNSLGSFSYQIVNLQNGYDNVRAQISDLETAENAPGTPEALHSFDFQLTPGTEEPNVNVHLSAIPKRHTEENAVFSVRRDGREVAAAECIWDGTAYVGQLDLPMENGYEYWLILYDLQGNQEQIPLQDTQAQNLKTTFSLTCEIRQTGHLTYENGELVLQDFEVAMSRPESIADGAVIQWDCVEVLLYHDGEELSRNVLITEEDDAVFHRSAALEFGYAALSFPDVTLENGDGLEIWVRASLTNGMECLEMVSSWGYEDGIFYGGELAERVTQD